MVLTILYYLPFVKKYQWVLLLAASYIFYTLAGNHNLIYIIITTIVTYIGAILLDRKNTIQEEYVKAHKGILPKQEIKDYKEKIKKEKHKITFFCVFINLGMLIVIKYGSFLMGNVGRIFGKENLSDISFLQIAVPLGISYYTLISIGYLLDVSKGKCKSEKNLFKTALFVSYFPQITQGPFSRFTEMAPRLFTSHKFSYENLSYGCQRILWGFFKKMVIADRMKPMVDAIFENYQECSGFSLLLGCMYFSIQLYADFSGYMDIVCGCSNILGIELAENFKRPFFSKSLAEYWRRWHITLCSWFRDYLFYPLSISKAAVKFGRIGKKILPPSIAKLVPSIFALSIIWLSTGLWHDASWRYVFWGIYNGVIIIASMCLEPWFIKIEKKLNIKAENKLFQGFQMIRTFLIISLLKVFPIANSTKGSLVILYKIFFEFQMELSRAACFPTFKTEDFFCVGIGLLIFIYVSFKQEKAPMHESINRCPFVVRWAIYLVLLLMILTFGVFDTGLTGGFEYAQY